jgi:hypothetical protein
MRASSLIAEGYVMKTIVTTALFVCLLAIGACGPSQGDQRARLMAQRYYELIQQGKFDEAARFYPEKDRGMWLDTLQQNQQKLGALKSFQIGEEEQNTVYSGKFYIYTVDTQYERGQESETLTLKSWVSADDAITVISQKLDSE